MARRLELTPAALRDLRAMPTVDAKGILNALDIFVETGRGDVRKLKGQRSRWALRWGNWRAIYTERGEILSVQRIKNRKEAYR